MGISVEQYRQRIGCFGILGSFKDNKCEINWKEWLKEKRKDFHTAILLICLVVSASAVLTSSVFVLDLTQWGDVEKNPGPNSDHLQLEINKMTSLKNLKQRCVAVLHNHLNKVLKRPSKSDKAEQSVQYVLQRLVTVFDLWHSLSFIPQRNKDIGSKWTIHVQDFNRQDSVSFTLCIHSTAEFKRFQAFLRHLISNWFHDIKLQKLQGDALNFIVTHPAMVALHIFAQNQTRSDEHTTLSTSKASNVEMVSKVLSGLLTDFCLHLLTNPEVHSEDTEKKSRSQSPDKTLTFQGGDDVFTTSPSYVFPPDVLLQKLKQAYVLASGGAENSTSQLEEPSAAPKQSSEVEYLKKQNAKLKKSIQAMAYQFERQRTILQSQVEELTDQTKLMGVAIKQKDAELKETLLELGRVSVEFTRVLNQVEKKQQFDKTYRTQAASTQTSEVLPLPSGASAWSDQTSSTEINRAEPADEQAEGHYQHCHEQESLNETVSLSDMPHTGVDGSIYNNYRFLLLQITQNLLKEDVLKLKQWVQNEFAIDASWNVNAILLELDRKKVISVTDLSRLKKFFEEIVRYDFVHLIDCFLRGDYGFLRNLNRNQRSGPINHGSNLQRFLPISGWSATRGRPFGLSQGPAGKSSSNAPGSQSKFQGLSRATEAQTGNGGSSAQQSTQQNAPGSDTRQSRPVTTQDPLTISAPTKSAVRNITSATSQGLLVTDGGRREESEVQANSSQERYEDPGSNGQRLSRLQRPDSSGRTGRQRRGSRGEDYDNQWLCSHYKRRCYVKFECCEQFWACHRCHNNQSSCGRKKLKSRDTQKIKCSACGQEQPFAQHCTRCNAKFAKYFCGLCKHLTGTDDNPYHCEKCGICRIHGDRSFHCDICGVCLDVQLRGNHKCREDSAHDECCICLEDAFTGCQILPCSHKVHKECATQMIRSGITRCPICRESFAHKLERKPHPSRKPPGNQ